MPGLMVLPVSAARSGWATWPSLRAVRSRRSCAQGGVERRRRRSRSRPARPRPRCSIGLAVGREQRLRLRLERAAACGGPGKRRCRPVRPGSSPAPSAPASASGCGPRAGAACSPARGQPLDHLAGQPVVIGAAEPDAVELRSAWRSPSGWPSGRRRQVEQRGSPPRGRGSRRRHGPSRGGAGSCTAPPAGSPARGTRAGSRRRGAWTAWRRPAPWISGMWAKRGSSQPIAPIDLRSAGRCWSGGRRRG